MNMPARSGQQIHQIICEHQAASLAEFVNELQGNDFLIVDEYYRDTEAPRGAEAYYPVGNIAINYRYVGKVKVMGHVTRSMEHKQNG